MRHVTFVSIDTATMRLSRWTRWYGHWRPVKVDSCLMDTEGLSAAEATRAVEMYRATGALT